MTGLPWVAFGDPDTPEVSFADGDLVFGGFTVDFSDYPDGPVPEAATGLRDNFLDDPDNEDEMGIRDGKLAVVEFRGPDQAFSTAEAGGGRRGYLWRNTVTLVDNVSAPVEVPSGLGQGSPVLHVNNDFEGSEYVGVACWFIPPPFSWIELGLIGKLQEDFSYLDITPGATMPEEGDEIRLRSVDGMVAIEVNGVTVAGPCELPAGIAGSAIHGVQMDVMLDEEEALGLVEGVTIESDDTPLTERSAPAIEAIGTAAETASATTINVPYPAGIEAGDTLYAIVATKNAGTFSAPGWTTVPTQFGVTAGIQVGVLRKTATGSEAGNLTVTKSTAGVMAGTMLRFTGVGTGVEIVGQGNSTPSTSLPSKAMHLVGPYRTLIWVAALSVDANITAPADWTPISTGVSGSQDIRLYLAATFADVHPGYGGPHNAYDLTNFPAQTGTAASAAASAVGILKIHPAPA